MKTYHLYKEKCTEGNEQSVSEWTYWKIFDNSYNLSFGRYDLACTLAHIYSHAHTHIHAHTYTHTHSHTCTHRVVVVVEILFNNQNNWILLFGPHFKEHGSSAGYSQVEGTRIPWAPLSKSKATRETLSRLHKSETFKNCSPNYKDDSLLASCCSWTSSVLGG